MKFTIKLLVLLGAIALPAISQARMYEAKIKNFVYDEEPEECAVDVEIGAIEGGLINGAESLRFNDKVVGNLSGLDFGAGYDVGDRFLFASQAFAIKYDLQLGLDYDVEIDDQDCADLKEDDEVSFDGSFDVDLSRLTLNNFQLNYAYSYNVDEDDYDEYDLSDNSIKLYSLSQSLVVGNGALKKDTPAFNSLTSTNCALTQTQTDQSLGSAALAWLMGGSLLALIQLRRKAKQ